MLLINFNIQLKYKYIIIIDSVMKEQKLTANFTTSETVVFILLEIKYKEIIQFLKT